MTWNRTKPTEMTDQDLVVGIVEDPDLALCELYRRHETAVRKRAMSVLGDRGMAEGVVQEVFLHLWQHPDEFDASRGTLRTFMVMLSRSRAVEAKRSANARRRREERCGHSPEYRSPEPGPGSLVEMHLLAEHLHVAVSRLSDIERSAIEVTYFEGRTFVDAARVLGRPEGTVKTRIRSGLGHLRVAMGSEISLDR
ncbi:MAG: sigma-70 family RNA polymerase sigma factor [Microthrixaceae bacterium]